MLVLVSRSVKVKGGHRVVEALARSGPGADMAGSTSPAIAPTASAMHEQRSLHPATNIRPLTFHRNASTSNVCSVKAAASAARLSVIFSHDGIFNIPQVSPTWHRTRHRATKNITRMYPRQMAIMPRERRVPSKTRFLSAILRPTRRHRKTSVKF